MDVIEWWQDALRARLGADEHSLPASLSTENCDVRPSSVNMFKKSEDSYTQPK